MVAPFYEIESKYILKVAEEKFVHSFNLIKLILIYIFM